MKTIGIRKDWLESDRSYRASIEYIWAREERLSNLKAKNKRNKTANMTKV